MNGNLSNSFKLTSLKLRSIIAEHIRASLIILIRKGAIRVVYRSLIWLEKLCQTAALARSSLYKPCRRFPLFLFSGWLMETSLGTALVVTSVWIISVDISSRILVQGVSPSIHCSAIIMDWMGASLGAASSMYSQQGARQLGLRA